MSLTNNVSRLKRQDPRLGGIIEQVGPCRLAVQEYGSTFEALARSITYQQLSGKAAATIYGRFNKRYGDGSRADAGRVARAQMRGLRSVGLSNGKARYIRGLARAQVSGDLPGIDQLNDMSDESVIQALTPLLGVGVWTVQMLLIFWLGRRDVLAPDDLGIRKGLMITDGMDQMPTTAQVVERGEAWRPYRSLACWYLWRACDL